MDTPQVTPELLDAGLAGLADGADAVLGAAHDGGYWAIGLERPDARVFHGVPMSEPHTGAVQRERLAALGLRDALPPAACATSTRSRTRGPSRRPRRAGASPPPCAPSCRTAPPSRRTGRR